jgi:hypothetical protein
MRADAELIAKLRHVSDRQVHRLLSIATVVGASGSTCCGRWESSAAGHSLRSAHATRW